MGKLSNANLTSPFLRICPVSDCFPANDAAGMAQQVAWSAGKPGSADWFLDMEANTAAYSGRLREGTGVFPPGGGFRRASRQKGNCCNVFCRVRPCGKPCSATQRKHDGVPLRHWGARRAAMSSTARRWPWRMRGTIRAQALADDLGKRFPESTLVQFNYLPTLRAKLALSRGNATEAIESLRVAAPYELGKTSAS